MLEAGKTRLRKRKSLEEIENNNNDTANEAKKKLRKRKEEIKPVEVKQINNNNNNEIDLDLTKTCPNEIIIYILSFLTYKEVLSTYYDKRWVSLSNGKEVWGAFCRKMRWTLHSSFKKMTYKEFFKRRISSKSYCCCCGGRTSAKFPLLQIILCPKCRSTEPEFATLNKTQSKAEYLLDDDDLSKVKFVISSVGWGRKKYVFLKSDIIEAAMNKYGGKAGLDAEMEKRLNVKKMKSDKQNQKKEQRAQELQDALIESGWNDKFAIGSRKIPILLPNEMMTDDYEQYLRAPAKRHVTSIFSKLFFSNCQRYSSSGLGLLFAENILLVDQIVEYFEKERATKKSNDNTNTTTTTTTTTTTAVAATTDESEKTEEKGNDNKSEQEEKKEDKSEQMATFAGVTYDPEIRKFYIGIIFSRIEQIWKHPGRFDIEPESVEEDDYMGVLFDKHAHFMKLLRTPNHILEKIYEENAIFGIGDDDDNDSEYDSSDDGDDPDML